MGTSPGPLFRSLSIPRGSTLGCPSTLVVNSNGNGTRGVSGQEGGAGVVGGPAPVSVSVSQTCSSEQVRDESPSGRPSRPQPRRLLDGDMRETRPESVGRPRSERTDCHEPSAGGRTSGTSPLGEGRPGDGNSWWTSVGTDGVVPP